MTRISKVKVLDNFRVQLVLTDGRHKIVDLEPYLHGPIFEPIKNDRPLFKTVKVDKELGTIVWDNGADIDPDVLIEDLTPAWMESNHQYSTPSLEVLAVNEKKKAYAVRKRAKK
ncbi:MAG: DUF2442 domain-containing protein [Bacteroidetes bacterium]|nr:MAG: DUF2442 domain-containing protein [Bacteroidota bacterium]